MIGIDIVSINRIERLVQQYEKVFLKKILNEKEIALCSNQNGFNIERIAGFFATKEALSKALGCGIGKNLRFSDIEITKDNLNAPHINLSKRIKEYFMIDNISVSISHDNGFVVSAVIVSSTNVSHNNHLYLLFLESKISKENLLSLKHRINNARCDDLEQIVLLDLKSPNLAMIFSICFGWCGVDRLYQGRIGLGIAKMCLSWIFFPWIIIDWFLIRDSIKKDNMQKILELLN